MFIYIQNAFHHFCKHSISESQKMSKLSHVSAFYWASSLKTYMPVFNHLSDRLKKIKGIYVLGDPQVTVVAIASKEFNVFRLSDALTHRGFSLNPLQFPSR